MIPTLRELQECLSALAKDPIRDLTEKGIKGVPGDCHTCPLGRRVALEFSLPTDQVWIGEEDVWISDDQVNIVLQTKQPKALERFVAAFDRREIPQLIEEEVK